MLVSKPGDIRPPSDFIHSKPKDINIKDLRDLEKNVLFPETGPRERPGEPEGLSL